MNTPPNAQQGYSPRASPFFDRDEAVSRDAAEELESQPSAARLPKNSISPEPTLPSSTSSKFVFKEDVAGGSKKKRLSVKVMNALQVRNNWAIKES